MANTWFMTKSPPVPALILTQHWSLELSVLGS